MTQSSAGNNAAQAELWNGEMGRKWALEQDSLDAMLAPLGLGGIAKANFAPGENVIDIGCGCGTTSLAIAEKVGSGGRVLGVDISEPMLEQARRRAAALDNATFNLADASVHKFAPASANVIFSRFGVMFFADPTAAFANIRTVLKPDGRLCLVVWRPVRENPWVMKSLMIAAKHVVMPAPLGPEEPGPFSFGDPARVTRILEGAGFKNVKLEPQDLLITIGAGRDLNGAVDFLLGIGPIRMILAEQTPELREKVSQEVKQSLAADFGPQGLRMGTATWIVTATNR
ncbi:MAG: class I SAM-dependent methyltransferase [Alphaproteobacteria bacterium]|nr:class I SAM-dependent methyltransferase [Alphaproteobacteria bacterium]